MTCAHHACTSPARRRGVCARHYDQTIRAGRRAIRDLPARRLTAAVAEMRAA